MFEHFYQQGGRIFDTAYIYNNGLSDKYLGNWIRKKNIQDEVIILGKGAHTPQCEPSFIEPQIKESLNSFLLSLLIIDGRNLVKNDANFASKPIGL